MASVEAENDVVKMSNVILELNAASRQAGVAATQAALQAFVDETVERFVLGQVVDCWRCIMARRRDNDEEQIIADIDKNSREFVRVSRVTPPGNFGPFVHDLGLQPDSAGL